MSNFLFAASAGRVQADHSHGGHNRQSSQASVAAARRRFAASPIDDVDESNNNTSYTSSSPIASARGGNIIGSQRSSPSNSNNKAASYTTTTASSLFPESPPNTTTTAASAAAAPTHLTDAQLKLLSTRGACTSILYPTCSSAQSAAAAARGRVDWTTNLYREFRPNAVLRSVESFERSLTVNSVEARLHALRSVYHCAADGAACRAALRQKLPKLVAAVAAVANEADATRQGGNRLCDMVFRLLTVMLHDDEKFDADAVLDDTLMAVVAPRCLLAGGDAAFSAASFLRRVTEVGSVAHAIVHNDILLDSVLRVLEEESLWFQEQQHRALASIQQQQRQHSPTSAAAAAVAPLMNNNNNNARSAVSINSNSQAAVAATATATATNTTRSVSQPLGSEAVTIECAATVIQLRIALLNVCSRATAATFLLAKSQRFVSLLARDGEMGVWASKGLLNKKIAMNSKPDTATSAAGAVVAFGDRTLSQEAVMYAAAQAHSNKTLHIAGAVLEEKMSVELANGKRRLFLPSHVVTLALAGAIFDSPAVESDQLLGSVPAHPSVPSEGGGAIPASKAARASNQPLQCRLEASRTVRGDEVAVLAAVSSVLSLRTLHAMCVREGRSAALAAVQPQLIRALTACLAHVGTGIVSGGGGGNNLNLRSPSSSSVALPDSAAAATAGGGEACGKLLTSLRTAAAAAIDVLEEADSANVVRYLENMNSEGKAMLDKLRAHVNQ